MEQGRKLRTLYRSIGWSRRDCAEFLHLDEKTLRNWEAGRHGIPFAALKLLRLHLGYELPGKAWRDWSISRGKLCTPEGHELDPRDAAWWSLLVRRAEVGSLALTRLHLLRSSLVSSGSGVAVDGPVTPAAGRVTGAEAAGLVLNKTR